MRILYLQRINNLKLYKHEKAIYCIIYRYDFTILF
jgi:hypothetical protein